MRSVKAYMHINALDEHLVEDQGWEKGDDKRGLYLANWFESIEEAEEESHKLVDLLFAIGVRIYDINIIDESVC